MCLGETQLSDLSFSSMFLLRKIKMILKIYVHINMYVIIYSQLAINQIKFEGMSHDPDANLWDLCGHSEGVLLWNNQQLTLHDLTY